MGRSIKDIPTPILTSYIRQSEERDAAAAHCLELLSNAHKEMITARRPPKLHSNMVVGTTRHATTATSAGRNDKRETEHATLACMQMQSRRDPMGEWGGVLESDRIRTPAAGCCYTTAVYPDGNDEQSGCPSPYCCRGVFPKVGGRYVTNCRNEGLCNPPKRIQQVVCEQERWRKIKNSTFSGTPTAAARTESANNSTHSNSPKDSPFDLPLQPGVRVALVHADRRALLQRKVFDDRHVRHGAIRFVFVHETPLVRVQVVPIIALSRHASGQGDEGNGSHRHRPQISSACRAASPAAALRSTPRCCRH